MGVLIRPASIVLLIFAAIGIYGFQWDLQNGVQPDQIISALNEVSIVGGLLFLLAESGSGTFQLAKGGMVDGRTSSIFANAASSPALSRAKRPCSGDESEPLYATPSPQPLGGAVKVNGKWLGGTGKYAGLSGEFDITNSGNLSTDASYTQSAGKKTGSYKISK